jgi:hypothetical protein
MRYQGDDDIGWAELSLYCICMAWWSGVEWSVVERVISEGNSIVMHDFFQVVQNIRRMLTSPSDGIGRSGVPEAEVG